MKWDGKKERERGELKLGERKKKSGHVERKHGMIKIKSGLREKWAS